MKSNESIYYSEQVENGVAVTFYDPKEWFIANVSPKAVLVSAIYWNADPYRDDN